MNRAEPKANRSWTPRWRHILRILDEVPETRQQQVDRLRRAFTEYFHLVIDHDFHADTYPDQWFSIQGSLIDRVGDLVWRLHGRFDRSAVDSVLGDVDADTLGIWLVYIDQSFRRGWWSIDNPQRDDKFEVIREYIEHRKAMFNPYQIVTRLREQKVSWFDIGLHMEKHYDIVKSGDAWRVWLSRHPNNSEHRKK